MRLDVIAFGETMLALAPPAGESVRTAQRFDVDHAGAESNTCVGLARLGFHTAWVSRLGADAAGDRILDALQAEGVDTRWVRRDPARPTGMMIKDPGAGVRYYRTGSAASAMTADDFADAPITDARAVLVTGVTALIGPDPHAAGLAFLSAAHGLRIVDPNLRRGLWGSERRAALVRPFVERSTLLLAGSDELAELFDAPSAGLPALARLAIDRGVREVVVRGPGSVGTLERSGAWTSLVVERRAAVDPIGAGDAFNAGYIGVRLRDGTVGDALAAGARCGASVTTTNSDTAAFADER